MLYFENVKKDYEIKKYIEKADDCLNRLDFTEHSFAHVNKVAKEAGRILWELDYPERSVELAKIAGYMHDIGNVINRENHAHSGAILAIQLLKEKGMGVEDTLDIAAAIGNHDEGDGKPVSEISAALILADKCDMRRSRVRSADKLAHKIYDRVEYAVENSGITVSTEYKVIQFDLTMDLSITTVVEYLNAYMTRIIMCVEAAKVLKCRFVISVNGKNLTQAIG